MTFVYVPAVETVANVNAPVLLIDASPETVTAVGTLPALPTQIFPLVNELLNLLLKVVKSADAK